MNHDHLVRIIDAAYRAGCDIMEVYRSCADMQVTYKTDDSPLTVADRRAHGIIKSALRPLGLPVLSEEGRSIPFEERRQWESFWLVDPLDGTKEFIKRNGEFTINIALIQNTSPVMGVIYVPVKDELFFAARPSGAFKIGDYSLLADQKRYQNAKAVDKLRILFSEAAQMPLPNPPERPYVVVGSRSHGTPELADYVRRRKQFYPDLELISAGSSLKICLVAEGKADEYPRLGPTMEWDTAAGQAIAECAGAPVLDYETRRPLRYNKPDLLNPWFIVGRMI